MKVVIATFFVGLVIGVFFSLLGLPIPAPPNVAGVLGVVGIYCGYLVVYYFSKKSKQTRQKNSQ